MQRSNCHLHFGEEEKYLCSHPSCIKQQGNKLMCIECFEKHKKGRTKFHEKISVQQIYEIAQQQMENYIQLQEFNIKRCENYSKDFEQSLGELLNNLTQWQDKQVKIIQCSKEVEILILRENILKAKKHYQISQLDNLVYFYKLNIKSENDIFEELQSETERELNYQIKEILHQGEVLISKQFNFQELFKVKKMDMEIQQISLPDYKFQKCEFHKAKKNYICIHEIQGEEKSFQPNCLGCLENKHEQSGCEKKFCLKKITKLLKEQERLKQTIKDESQKVMQKEIEYFNNLIENLNSQQKQNYEYYEKIREDLKRICKDSIMRLKFQPIGNLILDMIDTDLFSLSDEVLQKNLEQEFKLMQQKFELLKQDKPVIQEKFQILDQECDRNKKFIAEMSKTIEILTQKAHLYDKQQKQQQISNAVQMEENQKQLIREMQKLKQEILDSNRQFGKEIGEYQFEKKQMNLLGRIIEQNDEIRQLRQNKK